MRGGGKGGRRRERETLSKDEPDLKKKTRGKGC